MFPNPFMSMRYIGSDCVGTMPRSWRDCFIFSAFLFHASSVLSSLDPGGSEAATLAALGFIG